MIIQQFTEILNRLTVDDIHRLAAELRAATASSAGEVAWWHATMCIDAVIRRQRISRRASAAASAASRAVIASAQRSHISLPDSDVTHVARSAALVARGLLAGEKARAEVLHLMRAWQPTVARAQCSSSELDTTPSLAGSHPA